MGSPLNINVPEGHSVQPSCRSQAVISLLISSCQVCHQTDSRQSVVRKLLCCCQTVIRQLSGSHKICHSLRSLNQDLEAFPFLFYRIFYSYGNLNPPENCLIQFHPDIQVHVLVSLVNPFWL
jgi:hypothetical protein